MTVRAEPKQDRSRQTRRLLLETTVRALATEGYEASSVGGIAERAGVSRGALQHHFPTREDLIIAALEYMFEERVTMVDALPDPGGTGPERVHAVVVQLVDLVGGELFRAALQVWTVAAADSALREAVLPLERRFGREAHRRAVRLLGVDDSDPEVRAMIQATLDLARGLALADVLTDDAERRSHVLRAWSAQLAASLAGRAAPPSR